MKFDKSSSLGPIILQTWKCTRSRFSGCW